MRHKDAGPTVRETRTEGELVRDARRAARRAAHEADEGHRSQPWPGSWLTFSIALVLVAAILFFLKLYL
jgi:hypothetical protein